jgi:anaerobic magnesium-protoporphyrin IX monomethyl ester cyclase
MKVLLVVKSKIMETLGPMYLSSVIKQCGHDCKIVDIAKAIDAAVLYKPNFIGYSVHTGDQDKFKALNNALKNKINFTSIFGGYHASFFPEDFSNDDNINIVIQGEAEQAMADLLQSGLKYPNIDSIPHPDRTDFPGMKIRDFITSRGCPYNCSYCYNESWAKLFPKAERVRTRSVGDVIKEIKDVSPKFVYFQDSCFGVNMQWLEKFSIQYRHSVNVPFHCHLRPNQVTTERVALLHDANCISTRIALESASPKLRKLMGRDKIDLAMVEKSAKLLKKWNIELMIQNILGLPTATIEDDLETLEANIRFRPSYAWCSIFSPYPGTKLGDWCKKEGWYKGDYSDVGDNFFDMSVLEFHPDYLEQVAVLQKVFALCVETRYMPKVEELTRKRMPELVHKAMRHLGDKRLYGGVI